MPRGWKTRRVADPPPLATHPAEWDWIRYYEKIKLLPAPLRTGGGHRLYGPRERRTLAFIRRARELGFTVDEIRALLELGAPGNASCAEVRTIAAHHLDDIRAKIADLKKLERLLASTIAKCSGRKVPECPVVDILDIPSGEVDSPRPLISSDRRTAG